MNDNKRNNRVTVYEIGAKRKKILSFKPNNVLAGIIYSEILGRPKGRRGLVRQSGFKGINSR